MSSFKSLFYETNKTIEIIWYVLVRRLSSEPLTGNKRE
jgi:hypothetical protein